MWWRSIPRRCRTRSACCSSIRTTSRASKAPGRRNCSTRCTRRCGRRSSHALEYPLPLWERVAKRSEPGEGFSCFMFEPLKVTPHPVLAPDDVRGSADPLPQGERVAPAREEGPQGRLAQNIVYFARALRAAGIPVGPGSVLDALSAVQAAGVGTREDFYWTLHAVFVKRHEHSVLFDQAFRMFFRKRAYLDKLLAMLSPQAPAAAPAPPQAGASRVQEALFAGMNDRKPPEEREVELDARFTVSDREVLQRKDFAQMSAAEIAQAKDAIKRMVLALDEVQTRRLAPHRRGRIIDMRRTLRASMKAGGALIDLKYLGQKTKQPPIVALLDISGSMSQYTRLFLHF